MNIAIKLSKTNQLKFILVRAGANELDCQGRISGSLDLPLSESGQLEVQLTAEELNGMEIDAVYSSAGMAAKETAQQIAGQNRSRFFFDEKLTNLDCGLWHGKSIEELRERQPRMLRQWRDNPDRICPPQGETANEARERVQNLLKKIRRKHRIGNIVIVAPDPLLSIIRNELTPGSLPAPKIDPARIGEWKMVETVETAE